MLEKHFGDLLQTGAGGLMLIAVILFIKEVRSMSDSNRTGMQDLVLSHRDEIKQILADHSNTMLALNDSAKELHSELNKQWQGFVGNHCGAYQRALAEVVDGLNKSTRELITATDKLVSRVTILLEQGKP